MSRNPNPFFPKQEDKKAPIEKQYSQNTLVSYASDNSEISNTSKPYQNDGEIKDPKNPNLKNHFFEQKEGKDRLPKKQFQKFKTGDNSQANLTNNQSEYNNHKNLDNSRQQQIDNRDKRIQDGKRNNNVNLILAQNSYLNQEEQQIQEQNMRKQLNQFAINPLPSNDIIPSEFQAVNSSKQIEKPSRKHHFNTQNSDLNQEKQQIHEKNTKPIKMKYIGQTTFQNDRNPQPSNNPKPSQSQKNHFYQCKNDHLNSFNYEQIKYDQKNNIESKNEDGLIDLAVSSEKGYQKNKSHNQHNKPKTETKNADDSLKREDRPPRKNIFNSVNKMKNDNQINNINPKSNKYSLRQKLIPDPKIEKRCRKQLGICLQKSLPNKLINRLYLLKKRKYLEKKMLNNFNLLITDIMKFIYNFMRENEKIIDKDKSVLDKIKLFVNYFYSVKDKFEANLDQKYTSLLTNQPEIEADETTDNAFKEKQKYSTKLEELERDGSLEDREKTTFAKHISIINPDWLKDSTIFSETRQNEIQNLIKDRMKNEYHCQIPASNFMIDQFRKKFQPKIFQIFQEYQKNFPKAKSFLIYDCEQCLIKVVSSKDGERKFKEERIEKLMIDWMTEERKKHRQKVIIQRYKESQNYVVIGEGYKIIDVLLPHEFVKVKIVNLPLYLNGKEICKHVIENEFSLKSNPNYCNLFIHKSENKSYAQVQFLTYASANAFVYNTNLNIPQDKKEIYVTGIPESKIQQNIYEKFSLHVQIPIAKPTGKAFFNFSNEEDRDLTFKNLLAVFGNVKKTENRKKINEENKSFKQMIQQQIFSIKVSGLDINITEKQLQKYVYQILGGFDSIVIDRHNSDENPLQIIEYHRMILQSYATSVVPHEQVSKIFINIESGKKGYLKAKINFPSKEYSEKFYEQYKDEQTENGLLEIEYINNFNIFIEKDVFKLIEKQYQKIKKEYNKDIQFQEGKKDNQVPISLSIINNQTVQLLNTVFLQVKNLFKPYNYIFDVEYWQLDKLFEKHKDTIKKLEIKHRIIMKQNPKKSDVRVWFQVDDQIKKQEILNSLQSEFSLLLEGKKYLKLLKLNNHPKVIEFLIQQKKQNSISKFKQIGQEIVIEGSIGKLCVVVSEINKNFRKDDGQIVCQICCDGKNLERLDQCGCLYCKDCIGEYIVTSGSEVLGCPNHKDKPITLEDTYDLINTSEENSIIEKKINSIIDTWKNSQNRLPKFIRCKSTNCDSFFGRIYKKNDKLLNEDMPLRIRCNECYKQYCLNQTSIGLPNPNIHNYHQGECEDISIIFDYQLENIDAKKCPQCSFIIIKNGGCDHMTCTQCQTHFCWKCTKDFPSAGEVYLHLNTCNQ